MSTYSIEQHTEASRHQSDTAFANAFSAKERTKGYHTWGGESMPTIARGPHKRFEIWNETGLMRTLSPTFKKAKPVFTTPFDNVT